MALNAAAIDTRIKAAVASTMYDMTRVNAKGYFDAEDSEEERYKKKTVLNAQRTKDFKNGTYALAGGVADVIPDDAPFLLKTTMITTKPNAATTNARSTQTAAGTLQAAYHL